MLKSKFIKELFFDSFLILIFIFILNIQIIFFGKTYLTYGAFDVMEGVKNYKGFIPKEITVIDPAGSTWIDFPLSQINSRKILNGKYHYGMNFPEVENLLQRIKRQTLFHLLDI